jgi:hypothetical protein
VNETFFLCGKKNTAFIDKKAGKILAVLGFLIRLLKNPNKCHGIFSPLRTARFS